jgi:GNAT superfamily N-acetyltransferase
MVEQRFQRPGFTIALRNGAEVFLGPVLPEDRNRLAGGLKKLSAQSRYMRFFEGLNEFTSEQLRYFTEVDQVDHVAWGALDIAEPGWPGVALGRFVLLPEPGRIAEFALVVVDAFQNQGLGSALLAILCILAADRRIRTLRGLVLPENHRVCTWMEHLGATITRTDEDLVMIDLPVTDPPPQARPQQKHGFQHMLQALRPNLVPFRLS